MRTPLESTHLYKLLDEQDKNLAAKVRLIREKVAEWLAYVPVTFPHYPSHAIDHSDRIASQLSRILFRVSPSGGAATPTVEFSTSELYCLLCAIYLHDIGMVVSPAAQAELMKNDAWKKFIATGGKGHTLYGEYEAAEAKKRPGVVDEHHLQAASALRQLIAEFIRRDHHERAVETLVLLPDVKSLVDDGDRMVFDTIMNICRGHGLTSRDLQDKRIFPQKQLILDDYVNVRFLARLLRIGDLLDLSKKRAGHLALTAVAALPKSAVPHWDQYIAKTIESPDPDRLEYTFECGNQDTHRVLRDWLGWLEEEVRETGIEQQHAERHKGWTPPKCKVASAAVATDKDTDPAATIIIKPATGATYTFHDWKFQMDQAAVIKLLTTSIYADKYAFIRELLQNALDANRCQMYKDFARLQPGIKPPKWPTKFDEATRNNYPVTMRIERECLQLPGEGEPRECDIFVIEDVGTGMTEEIIRDYFLQIGRSFYKSEAFRQAFSFHATSRFGIGFLSVFDASRHVVVETFPARPDGMAGDGIRIRLHAPTSYLLTETIPSRPGLHRRPGTTIRVALTEQSLDEERIHKELTELCVAVEVPVKVRGTDVRPPVFEKHTFLGNWPYVSGGKFERRVFRRDIAGCEVEVIVLEQIDDQGTHWAHTWPLLDVQQSEELERLPLGWSGHVSVHGMFAGRDDKLSGRNGLIGHNVCVRVDVRDDIAVNMPASRTSNRLSSVLLTRIHEYCQELVEHHLATRPLQKAHKSADYRRRVLSSAPVSRQWAYELPGTVTVIVHKRDERPKQQREAWSMKQLLETKRLVVVPNGKHWRTADLRRETEVVSEPIVTRAELDIALQYLPSALAFRCSPQGVFELPMGWGLSLECDVLEFRKDSRDTNSYYRGSRMPDSAPDAFYFRREVSEDGTVIDAFMNEASPLVKWFRSARSHVGKQDSSMSSLHRNWDVERLPPMLLNREYAQMRKIIEFWRTHPSLPAECRPPEVICTPTYVPKIVDFT